MWLVMLLFAKLRFLGILCESKIILLSFHWRRATLSSHVSVNSKLNYAIYSTSCELRCAKILCNTHGLVSESRYLAQQISLSIKHCSCSRLPSVSCDSSWLCNTIQFTRSLPLSLFTSLEISYYCRCCALESDKCRLVAATVITRNSPLVSKNRFLTVLANGAQSPGICFI